VATHFPDDPDLVTPALNDIGAFYAGPVAIARDFLVITVNTNGEISQSYAQVPEYPWYKGEPFKGNWRLPSMMVPWPSLTIPFSQMSFPRSITNESTAFLIMHNGLIVIA